MFFLILAAPHTALADEWRYCIAPSSDQHKVYMTPVFPTDQVVGVAESTFQAELDRSSLRYEGIQCPRSNDESSALMMQRQTVKFNRKLGKQIIELKWTPNS